MIKISVAYLLWGGGGPEMSSRAGVGHVKHPFESQAGTSMRLLYTNNLFVVKRITVSNLTGAFSSYCILALPL